MKKIVLVSLVLAAAAFCAHAATVTNRMGQVMSVSKMSEVMAASTASEDLSVPANKPGQVGMAVAHVSLAAGLAVGSHEISDITLPKGAILLPGAVIEVTTAIGPATCTNAVTVGGVTPVAESNGAMLHATGIKLTSNTTGQMLTSAGKVTLVITGAAATNGNFTMYLPYTLGTAQ